MNFEYASVADVMFFHADQVYAAVVEILFDGSGMRGTHVIAGHKLRTSVRFEGSADWPFSKVEEVALRVAAELLAKSTPILTNATGSSLKELNEQADAAKDIRRQNGEFV